MLRSSTVWLVILVFSIVFGLPTQVRLSLLNGLISLRPFVPILLLILARQILQRGRQGWRFLNPVSIMLGVLCLIILLRSVWAVSMHEPEIYFHDLTDSTGAPSWAGSIHARGVVTALLLVTYVALAVATAAYASHRDFGARLTASALRALLFASTLYAAALLLLLAYSVAAKGWDPTAWPIVIRGIDVGHGRTDAALAGFGPDDGILFATGAVLAFASARSNGKRRYLVLMAVVDLSACLATFSRGAVISLVVGCGCVVIAALGSYRSRVLALSMVSFGAATLLVLSAGPALALGPVLDQLTGSGTGGARIQQWQSMLPALLQNPIFGYGAESYRPYTAGFPAENFVLDIAFSGGLLALVALVLSQATIALWVSRCLGRAHYLHDKSVSALGWGFLTYSIGTMLNTSAWSPVYWLLMGLTAGTVYRLRVSHDARVPEMQQSG